MVFRSQTENDNVFAPKPLKERHSVEPGYPAALSRLFRLLPTAPLRV